MAEAFIAGVRRYMEEHPREVPEWAPKLEPWFVPMLARYMIWGWMEGEIGGKLQHAGIKPDPPAYRGSNEWLLARLAHVDGRAHSADRSSPELVRRVPLLRDAGLRGRARGFGRGVVDFRFRPSGTAAGPRWR